MVSTELLRKKEHIILDKVLQSNRPEFLALYGRRRVGKTHLIRNHFANRKNCIFFDVAGSKDTPMKEQILNFTMRMGEIFYGGAKLTVEKNWNDTFKSLTAAMTKLAPNQKIILFFDEFPWMATKNSRLLQQLDYYWNQYWSKDGRIKLIVCGSSASWIIRNIINNKGGLHNRITRHIHLEPFNLYQMKLFLKYLGVKLNNQQLLQIYMVTGGIPYYLMNIERGQSAAQIIDQLAFKRNAPLLNEFNNLFASLFDQHEVYVEIIRLIAKHRYGIARQEIFNQIDKNLKGKKGARILQSLEDTGFIIGFKPHLHKRKGIYYKVIDEYTLYYLSWIEPIKDSLFKQSFEEGYWQIQQRLPSWQSWSGYAFEAVCYKHIKQIKKALDLSPADIPSTWRYVPKKHHPEKGAQIDLLFDRQDHVITLCEIKYTDKPFLIGKSYAENLQRKMDVFKTQTRTTKQLLMTMIASSGIKNNFYADDIVSGVVTLDDLFLER